MDSVTARERAAGIIRRSTALRHGHVFHYTTIPALHGILTSKEIWCSDVRFMNDPDEIAYGRDMVESVAAPRLGRGRITAFLAKYAFEYYVASFTAASDSLSQWRAYSDDGVGVAMRFSARALADVCSAYNQLFARVVYGPARQRKIVERILDAYEPLLVFRSKSEAAGHARGDLLTLLAMLVATFKAHPYGPEGECRLIIAIPEAVQHQDYRKVRFRPTARAIVPYLAVPLTRGSAAIPVEQIVVGPRVSDASKQSLSRFLRASNQAVPVVRSTVRMQ